MQRPDATEFTLDPTRSSLTGWAGSIRAAKNSGRHVVWSSGLSAESPTFELNDVGRLGSANDIDGYLQVTYRQTEPGKIFQRYSLSPYIGRSWNFGGAGESVTAAKRAKLLAAARLYLASRPQASCRFDVFLVEGQAGDVRWIRDAFGE